MYLNLYKLSNANSYFDINQQMDKGNLIFEIKLFQINYYLHNSNNSNYFFHNF
jgi:hypothetical protein